jgi:hypothetical protein
MFRVASIFKDFYPETRGSQFLQTLENIYETVGCLSNIIQPNLKNI